MPYTNRYGAELDSEIAAKDADTILNSCWNERDLHAEMMEIIEAMVATDFKHPVRHDSAYYFAILFQWVDLVVLCGKMWGPEEIPYSKHPKGKSLPKASQNCSPNRPTLPHTALKYALTYYYPFARA